MNQLYNFSVCLLKNFIETTELHLIQKFDDIKCKGARKYETLKRSLLQVYHEVQNIYMYIQLITKVNSYIFLLIYYVIVYVIETQLP